MNYEELCDKFKPFLIKTSRYYGEIINSKYPYVDDQDFYSVGLEAIQKKMYDYRTDKSNGKSYENYMMTQIKYAMGAYAGAVTSKSKKEGDIRISPTIDEKEGTEFGGIESFENKDMDFYIQDSKVITDGILKILDSRSKYIVEQIVLEDKTLREVSAELDITIPYVSRLYEAAIEKTKVYLNQIDYLNERG